MQSRQYLLYLTKWRKRDLSIHRLSSPGRDHHSILCRSCWLLNRTYNWNHSPCNLKFRSEGIYGHHKPGMLYQVTLNIHQRRDTLEGYHVQLHRLSSFLMRSDKCHIGKSKRLEYIFQLWITINRSTKDHSCNLALKSSLRSRYYSYQP